ncbi:MAG: 30S ribosomal protein S16 [Bacteroidales bacterium]
MAVKIRLARKGRKRKAFYHIVVADSRAPRDGRFIEKLGVYSPITDPATIELDFDKALGWLQNGAQPTDTCRAILSYKGVMLKKHLLDGVRKGAFDEAEAERRFQIWLKEKENKIEAKISGIEKSREEERTQRLEAEKKINEERAEILAKKRMAEAEAEAGSEAGEEVEEVAEKAAETAEAEKPAEEKKEEVKAEAEKPAEEKKEEKKEEVKAKAEKPAEEKKEDTPKTGEAGDEDKEADKGPEDKA